MTIKSIQDKREKTGGHDDAHKRARPHVRLPLSALVPALVSVVSGEPATAQENKREKREWNTAQKEYEKTVLGRFEKRLKETNWLDDRVCLGGLMGAAISAGVISLVEVLANVNLPAAYPELFFAGSPAWLLPVPFGFVLGALSLGIIDALWDTADDGKREKLDPSLAHALSLRRRTSASGT